MGGCLSARSVRGVMIGTVFCLVWILDHPSHLSPITSSCSLSLLAPSLILFFSPTKVWFSFSLFCASCWATDSHTTHIARLCNLLLATAILCMQLILLSCDRVYHISYFIHYTHIKRFRHHNMIIETINLRRRIISPEQNCKTKTLLLD